MPVASPYAVFRAADLAWASRPCEPPRPLPPLALPRAARPRKRLAPAGVIQGELFLLPSLSATGS